MRVYRVHISDTKIQAFAGTMANARTARQRIVDEREVQKSKVLIDEFDLDTKKEGLINFLNQLVDIGPAGDTPAAGDDE